VHNLRNVDVDVPLHSLVGIAGVSGSGKSSLALRQTDWLIEIGPGSGRDGGTIIATGTPRDVAAAQGSVIAGFLSGEEPTLLRPNADETTVFEGGVIHLETDAIHTVHSLDAHFPVARLTAITGVSGSGKSTLLLDTLVPALQAVTDAERVMPSHIRQIQAPDDIRVQVVDATPIGQNVRSTVATYSGIMNELRKNYAATEAALGDGRTASDFSFIGVSKHLTT
jgi:excinuclease ABC subunit A